MSLPLYENDSLADSFADSFAVSSIDGLAGALTGALGAVLVNDVHSGLNPTWVEGIEHPSSLAELCALVRREGQRGRPLSIAGGRHSMGGQQFGSGTLLVDTRRLERVLAFDPGTGRIEVEAGIEWPTLIERCLAIQRGSERPWGIAQKQVGADRMTLGGALSANVHGRGLAMKPFVADVESFTLVDAHGEAVRCSRRQNPELFRLAAGGYGLFGIVYSVALRLVPRRKLERVVEVRTADGLAAAFEERAAAGFLYGDFQLAVDPRSPDFLRRGIFCCHRPLPDDTPVPDVQRELSDDEWREILYLAHTDKRRAFDRWAEHYRATEGQIDWSDTHQLGPYCDGYHQEIDLRLGAGVPGSERLTELFVPRPALAGFLADAAANLREHGDEVIDGSIRLVEPDEETFLPWARGRYACVVFNLHIDHREEAKRRAAATCRRLIDLAIARGGSFHLAFHRDATREQVEACYPRFADFLQRKLVHDPQERFQSDWYRHWRRLFV